jgi:uncharacterized protein YcfL
MAMRKTIALVLALVCVGCSSSKEIPADVPNHDQQTELRREKDCANPHWKSANLGLWYNVCRQSAF